MAAFNSEELMRLARAWIAVASGPQAPESPQPTSELFWEQVAVDYADKTPPTSRVRTVEELETQWKSMRPSMVAFTTLFTQKWKSSPKQQQPSHEAEVFEWAARAFRAASKRNFEFLAVAWLLVTNGLWWSVLRPQLMQQFALMHEQEEEELLQQETERDHGQPEFPLCPEQPETPGATRSRREEEDEVEPLERRVRPRLDSEDVHSLTSVEDQQCGISSRDPASPEKGKSRGGTEELEGKTAEMARLMERRLELDIMTMSEDGLSADAKEYLQLQRRTILHKLREKTP